MIYRRKVDYISVVNVLLSEFISQKNCIYINIVPFPSISLCLPPYDYLFVYIVSMIKITCS